MRHSGALALAVILAGQQENRRKEEALEEFAKSISRIDSSFLPAPDCVRVVSVELDDGRREEVALIPKGYSMADAVLEIEAITSRDMSVAVESKSPFTEDVVSKLWAMGKEMKLGDLPVLPEAPVPAKLHRTIPTDWNESGPGVGEYGVCPECGEGGYGRYCTGKGHHRRRV